MSSSTKSQILTLLSINPANLYSVHINPLKKCQVFHKQYVDKEGLYSVFNPLIVQLKHDPNNFDRTLLITQTRKQAAFFYQRFSSELDLRLFVHHDGNVRERIVEMFHGGTPDEVKEHIIKDFSIRDGNIKLLVCTNAFGMGVNCKGINRILHFGPSKSVENYIQECGRAGRDGKYSKCVLYYNGVLTAHISDEMRNYCYNTTECHRKFLDELFGQKTRYAFAGCECCSICLKFCDCGGVHDGMIELYAGEQSATKNIYRRNIPNKIKEEIKSHLVDISKCQISANCPSMLPTAFFQFGHLQIQQVLDNLEFISNMEELRKYVEVWQFDHANKVLQILSKFFGNIEISISGADDDIEMQELLDEWHEVLESDDEEENLDESLLNSTLYDSQQEYESQVETSFLSEL